MKKLKLFLALMSFCFVGAFSIHAMDLTFEEILDPECACLVPFGNHAFCPGIINEQVPGGCELVPCVVTIPGT